MNQPHHDNGRTPAPGSAPSPAAASLTGPRRPAPDHDARSLELLQRIHGEGLPAAREAVSALEGLHPSFVRHVVRFVASYRDRSDVLSAVTHALGQSSFRAIPDPKIQSLCFDVFLALPETSRPLFSRAVAGLTSGGSVALVDRDSNGRTLVSNLRAIAAGELLPALRNYGLSRRQLLSQVTQEALCPTRSVNQGLYKGTCVAACLHYMICCENPAEYSRLVHGLITRGKAALASGDTLELARNSLQRDETFPSRSDSERIFHAAIMEYSNGKRHSYCNQRDVHLPVGAGGSVIEAGLRPDMIGRGASGLFAEPFDLWAARSMLDLEQAKRPWWKRALGIGAEQSGPPVSRSQHREVVEWLKTHRGEHLLIALSWSAGEKLHGRHAVVYEGFRDGRYHFRNPWGAVNLPNGTQLADPPRRSEDSITGRESMAAADFEERLCVVVAPSRLQLAGALSAARTERASRRPASS